ncbi:hypothetical protein BJ875DRAFT_230401 [Amylocarpus encephaloides]|uniref:Uncharacterized protein n=1 Tax=Amylocarpus encephaloides TaxID=45428 RepID=A0A9P8C748_9HELO|nr:hypothetical protein BJ875DRAFT_230401 [Amylocarpus encephaloides]
MVGEDEIKVCAEGPFGAPAPSRTRVNDTVNNNTSEKPVKETSKARPRRRVDFHWIVKDWNCLLWVSNLLSHISKSAMVHTNDEVPHFGVRLQPHVTQKRKDISTHIYRYLLELHRTDEHPDEIRGLGASSDI